MVDSVARLASFAEPREDQSSLTLPRILLVDDEEAMRTLMSRALSRGGYRVSTAGAGAEGIAAAKADPPDLVILDYHLQDMLGGEVLRAMKGMPELAETPVIFVTGETDTLTQARLLEEGADDYIHKPVQIATLLARVRVHTRIKAQEDLLRLQRQEAEKRSLALAASNRELEQLNGRMLEAHEALEAANGDLARARVAADAASRAKTSFLASMSHEVRTPMNGVLGMLQLLQETPLSPEQLRLLQTMRSSADTLLAIISDILDISKIEEGKLELHLTTFSIREVAMSVLDLFAFEARRKGISLSRNIDDEVPAAVRGDAVRVRQVISNLVSNALKFTDTGTVDMRVVVQERRPERVVLRIEVEDTGVGISPEAQAQLFTPFYQAPTNGPRVRAGTGLGLAICKRVLEQMGGTIACRSAVGWGSRFTCTVPMNVATASTLGERTVSRIATASPAGSGSGAGLRVLIAEDNDISLQVAVSMLESLGCSVEVARNGAEAVETAAQGAFDLILMDCEMPVMGGLEATRRLRDAEGPNQGTPIVALTADVVDGSRGRCMDAGMDEFLSKPLLLRELDGVLRGASEAAASRPAPVTEIGPLQSGTLAVLCLQSGVKAVGGHTAILRSVLDALLQSVPEQIEDAIAALEAGDTVRGGRIAHAVKGAAASVAAHRLRDAAAAAERAAKSGDGSGALTGLRSMRGDLATLRETVSRIDWGKIEGDSDERRDGGSDEDSGGRG